MKRATSESEDRIVLNATHLERFHQLAPASLAARSGGFLLEQLSVGVEWLILGLTPIVGMLAFDWNGGELLGFLIAGAWISIAREVVRFTILFQPMQRAAERESDDFFVWLVAQTLRRGANSLPKQAVETKFVPGLGIAADLVAGGFGTLLLALLLHDKRPEIFREAWESVRVAKSLWIVAGWQFVSVLHEAIDCYWLSGGTRQVKSKAGSRGLGLFLLVFLFLTIVVSMEQSAVTLLMVVNGFFVIIGLISVLGVYYLRREIHWLRDYLASVNK